MVIKASFDIIDALHKYAPGHVLARLWVDMDGVHRLMADEPDLEHIEADGFITVHPKLN